MVFNPPATSYEEIPYASDPYRSSHPDNLATVAILAGLAPEPVDSCRVLELGCARGGNLIPMAFGLPRSRFLGIDASPGQISEARAWIDSLGLSNVEVDSRDILDFDPRSGTFDYIICHGTFSWAPADVQAKILEIFASNLSPSGIGYVSYNTYPGWHMRGLAREMMSYHARRYERAADRAAEARSLLQFMTNSASAMNPVYGNLLKEELDNIRDRPDSYLLHDHLESVNEPIYFHELVDRAVARGLQYVSEVQDSLVVPESLPYSAAEGLRRLSRDHIEFEQFVDFVINRRFRQSVFCHRDRPLKRTASPEVLERFHVASRFPRPKVAVPFRNVRLLDVALGHLNKIWPSAVSVPSLLREACRRLGNEASMESASAETERLADDLKTDVLRCYFLRVLELSTLPPAFVVDISEKPAASRLARHQSTAGNTVTNMRHEAGQVGDFGRYVLGQLDGTRDRHAILDQLTRAVNAGRLSVPPTRDQVGRKSMSDERPLEVVLAELLDRCLKKFARFALLVG
jgi:trans-aconitate methyltransferase